jgi:hypothetical protein
MSQRLKQYSVKNAITGIRKSYAVCVIWLRLIISQRPAPSIIWRGTTLCEGDDILFFVAVEYFTRTMIYNI